jgi:hypothetical protein
MAKTEEKGLTNLKNSQGKLQNIPCSLIPRQKQRPRIPDQEKPTPENPFQTRPFPIVLTEKQRFSQHGIHVGSFRPHECLVISSSFFILVLVNYLQLQ